MERLFVSLLAEIIYRRFVVQICMRRKSILNCLLSEHAASSDFMQIFMRLLFSFLTVVSNSYRIYKKNCLRKLDYATTNVQNILVGNIFSVSKRLCKNSSTVSTSNL